MDSQAPTQNPPATFCPPISATDERLKTTMCTFYTVKYLCNCIYDEWLLPCFFTRGPSILLNHPNSTESQSTSETQSSPDSPPNSPPATPSHANPEFNPCFPKPKPHPTKKPCYHTHIIETYDVLTLCEVCLTQLDKQIRAHGVKTVLASPERFPLAEKLGMLIVVENDALEQWRLFRKGEQCFLLERGGRIQSLGSSGAVNGRVVVPGCGGGVGKGPKVRGPDADQVWKVESSRIYRLEYQIYGPGEDIDTESEKSGSVTSGRGRKLGRKGVWDGSYYEERAMGHHPEPED
ncbi:hypothetical protein BJX68DRAFT_270630 [Aspergillus pseudodeflectus]|uniref:Uncharacterized protein n=1 Tax=Aspergillus pseudodeflectus TaxID=176178 RepID=A0ABR4JQY2_9EURO